MNLKALKKSRRKIRLNINAQKQNCGSNNKNSINVTVEDMYQKQGGNQ